MKAQAAVSKQVTLPTQESCSKFIVLILILNTKIQKFPLSEMSWLQNPAPSETFYTACHKTPMQDI